MSAPDRVLAGSLAELQEAGRLTTKLGSTPVVVFWQDDRAYAVEDRCPHLGFPLHRGTVEAGLVTCHWHNACFDLESGCTLDLWADDAKGFDVELDDDAVFVSARPSVDEVEHARRRLRDGLEDNLTLVIAKSVFALTDHGVDADELVRTGIEFGTRYRREGWGSGLTVLVAMANVLDELAPDDRPVALIHGLRFVARDTANHSPRFSVAPLETEAIPEERLASWYRRFIETRSSDAAERVLGTALGTGRPLEDVERVMMAAATDHVFLDGEHTVDFTNKAFEVMQHVGADAAGEILPTLVSGTASARRSEESGDWRYPHDLVALQRDAVERLEAQATAVEASPTGSPSDPIDVAALAWRLLEDDPNGVVDAVVAAVDAGADGEQLGRALALAASLRLVRFHVQNEHGDWDSVHHAFTYANALHQSMMRAPDAATARGVLHGALRVYLDRFLNIPPARLPSATMGDLDALDECWNVQGAVDTAGDVVWGHLQAGGRRSDVIAKLGHALLAEDPGFHWYQLFEASVQQAKAWPEGSDQSALILVGFARFLAAQTPTRRELPAVVRTALRLRRGDQLYEAEA